MSLVNILTASTILPPSDALVILEHLATLLHQGNRDNHDKVKGLLPGVIESLARHPEAKILRVELFQFFEPQLFGIEGRALLLSVVSDIFQKTSFEIAAADPLPPGLTDEAFEALMDWALARVKYITSLDDVDEVRAAICGSPYHGPHSGNLLHVLNQLVHRLAKDIGEPGTENAIALVAQLAVEQRSHTDDKITDLKALRSAVSVLGSLGRHQDSRDLAELALEVVEDDPARKRLAWFIFADAYARSNQMTEALLGTICFLLIDKPIDSDQGFFENFVGTRVLRDTGMIDLAAMFLERSDAALRTLPSYNRYSHRIEGLRVQLQFGLLRRGKDADQKAISALLERAVANHDDVLAKEIGDLAPSVANLVSVVNYARHYGFLVTDDIITRVRSNFEKLPPIHRGTLSVAFEKQTSAQSLCDLLNSHQGARYNLDRSGDLKPVKKLALSILDEIDFKSQLEDFVYLVEVLCDLRFEKGSSGLLDAVRNPAEAAARASLRGKPIVVVGMSRQNVYYVRFEDGRITSAEKIGADQFDTSWFAEWSAIHPNAYASAEATNAVYQTTDRLRFPNEISGCTVVASLNLQNLPPTLYRQGETFSGLKNAIALAPSLCWLDTQPGKQNRKAKRVFWVAGERPDSDGMYGLPRIMGQVRPLLSDHEFEVVLDNDLEASMKDACCLVMVAHGGLSHGSRSFSAFATEADSVIAGTRSLSDKIGSPDLVVSMSCSSGRIDSHIDGGVSVSFVSELLLKGCRTVIAPAWPFEVRLAEPWLKVFFTAFDAGRSAGDACFDANTFIHDHYDQRPELSLNMNVFGDQLLIREV